METPFFKPFGINDYSAQWQHLSPRALHQSNPQPLTLAELEQFIGPLAGLFDPRQPVNFTGSPGTPALRQAISTLYPQLSSEHIAVFAGAQEATFCAMHTLLAPGDKVVALAPVFEPIIHAATEIGCELELVEMQPGRQWQLDLNGLETAVAAGCKLLVLNFPHNPTGALISRQTLLDIVTLCDKHGCWILSDEVFRGLEHLPEQRLPPVADIYPRAVSIGVLSKAFALPGIRIGWLACQQPEVLQGATQLRKHFSVWSSYLDEIVATHAIAQHEAIWARNRQLLKTNLAVLEQFMAGAQTLFTYIRPQAGCCCFPLLNPAVDAQDFARELVEKAHLLVLPGPLFLTGWNGIRLGFGYEEYGEYYPALAQ